MEIAAISPFYQYKRGQLAEVLTSLFGHNLPAGVDLRGHIVDDESSPPARTEVESLPPGQVAGAIILSQPNEGPGATRDLARSHVAQNSADYVAFLDFDDIWHPQHLADALQILEQEFDRYFRDRTGFNAETILFESIPSLMEFWGNDDGQITILDSQRLVTPQGRRTAGRDVWTCLQLHVRPSLPEGAVPRHGAFPDDPRLDSASVPDDTIPFSVLHAHARSAVPEMLRDSAESQGGMRGAILWAHHMVRMPVDVAHTPPLCLDRPNPALRHGAGRLDEWTNSE